MVIFKGVFYEYSSLQGYSSSSSRCSLASSTIRLHWSLFLAFSIHPLIPILLISAITSSSHLILGLPILLVAYSFPFSTLLGMAVSSILSTWPSHCILCVFMNLTIYSPPISLHSSLLYLIRHNPLSTTGPYIFLSAFLSNLLRAFSYAAVRVHISAPYVTTDLITIMYICNLDLLDIILLLSVWKIA